jgi:hypothetical protein
MQAPSKGMRKGTKERRKKERRKKKERKERKRKKVKELFKSLGMEEHVGIVMTMGNW